MFGLGKTRTVGTPAATSRARRKVIYQRHAAALYGQALLMLDDSALAENVVCDAIVDECALVRLRSTANTRHVSVWPSLSSGAASIWPLTLRGTVASRSGLPPARSAA